MRIFAAVLPPDAQAAELARAAAKLKTLPGARALRWTTPEDWHFTLAFMAEVEDATVPELSDRLSRAAKRTAPFPLSLHAGGHFGDRALWTGAAGDIDTLRLLAARADAAARKSGITMEEHRHYRPHLTLARGKGEPPLAPYAEALATFQGEEWTVTELTLVRSNLPKSGMPGERPRYEVVGRWPLGGAG
ncbi:RNA 2',3'-cyclic phosphodiesterase [Streptomyces sp. MZ04]|uniref:RNA 2',3'-cyclic phosphodiesterase n=1 Tax=Streptomyces sp. MZ04 TaxID=2559236 RepID=UPI00107EDB9D|nr:RNA 2',3'-cyclic phosphodiesterase [Streptomyces sp. MZ04]TGB05682.1 RNA 2',3'-cyclic phosphodiesterase [Streptomyces sp. MZ04]